MSNSTLNTAFSIIHMPFDVTVGKISHETFFYHLRFQVLSTPKLLLVHSLLVCWILHPSNFVMKYCHGGLKLGWNSLRQ